MTKEKFFKSRSAQITHCPNCGRRMDCEEEVYAIDGEIVGCDQCVEVLYTDEIYYQQAMRQAQQDYIDSAMWEQRKNDIG